MARRRKYQPFVSGFCAYAPHQAPCKGEFQNGNLSARPVVLCSCECHGDYEARMAAAGQRMVEDVELPEGEDDDE